ncbi:acyl--CoA ligase [Paenibacillus silvae]|uniref:Acyl--CoA ligase n=1 Tax=Paenibacillus silvae TaxID=1325358 RepID=A0ABQ1ZCE6_9BACL|nr:acyl--CoA ligase [Paenibacillus silvae]
MWSDENRTFRIVDDAGEWSYQQIRTRIGKLAGALTTNGVVEGDRVAVLCENSVSFFVGIMSGLILNATVIPLDPQLPLNELIKLVKNVDAKILCTSGTRPERIIMDEALRIETNGITILDESSGHWDADRFGQYFTDTPKDPTVPAFILFTSGTSGHPKGVTLSHEAVCKNVQSIMDWILPSCQDRFLITKTLVHSSTLLCEVLVALRADATVFMLNPVVPISVTVKRILELKPTIIGLNPTLLWLLNRSIKDSRSSSVKLIVSSGAVAAPDLLNESERKWPNAKIINAYGLTEAGPRVTMQKLNQPSKKGSVGHPVPNVKIRVVKDGFTCQVNEIGCIFVKSDSMMNGYWKDNEATEQKIQAGWINTGDIGYLDEDSELFVVGRKDDMIIRGSHNIDPNYVEDVLRSYKGIKECLVFGVVDKVNSNKIVCYIVPEEDCGLDISKVFDYCAKLLAPYECPQEILLKDAIPKTSNGKVSRKLAAEQYVTFLTTSN